MSENNKWTGTQDLKDRINAHIESMEGKPALIGSMLTL